MKDGQLSGRVGKKIPKSLVTNTSMGSCIKVQEAVVVVAIIIITWGQTLFGTY